MTTDPVLTRVPAPDTRPADGHGIDLRERPTFSYDVALVGLGYVGLPTALAFHAAGRKVLGVDASAQRLDAIRDREVDLLESDHERLSTALAPGQDFALTADPASLADARTIVIAVPTPVDDHLVPDLGILRRACDQVVTRAVPGQTIILTSTTYVGSTRDLLGGPLTARGLVVGTDVYVAFSPERIDPGNDRHAHEDVPRVVGGATDACTLSAMGALGGYALNLHPVSSPGVAEMTKLFENTFRAVNIALVNEIADISNGLGIDVIEVVEAAATKPYGFMPFFPGSGAGGHCIPCDPHYLLWQLRRERQATPVIENAMSAIAARPRRVVDRVREVLSLNGQGIMGARVLLLGVAYKPDVQDLRESPALEILETLQRAGARVDYYDPLIGELRLRDGTALVSADDPTLLPADIVVVHTVHRGQDLSWLSDAPLVLDASFRLRDLPNRFPL
jgi:UDP-N-acetyl-D-glucosamine dehydrogenase